MMIIYERCSTFFLDPLYSILFLSFPTKRRTIVVAIAWISWYKLDSTIIILFGPVGRVDANSLLMFHALRSLTF